MCGMTQAGIAERCGVSFRAFQDYEAGKRYPSGQALKTIAELNVDISWLLTGIGQPMRGDEHPNSGVNSDLLRDCIAVLREEMELRNIRLTPHREAEAVSLLYDLASPKPGEPAKPVDRGVVVRLLRMAS